MPIKRRKFYEIFSKLPPSLSFNTKIKQLELEVKKMTNCPDESFLETKQIVKSFCETFTKKWRAENRTKTRFLRKNKKWLDEEICVPFFANRSSGRPSSDFLKSSERSKRRKTELLRSKAAPEALAYAAQMTLRASGKIDASKVIKDVTFTSPSRASKYRKSFTEKEKQCTNTISADGALSLLIDAQLSRHQYNIVRSHSKSTFPSYKVIQTAKKKCYPDTNSYKIEELKVEVSVQSLLDHTAQRIIESTLNDFDNYSSDQLSCVELISKWGCDGSSGQSQYKQKFQSADSSDSNIFLVSCVPLQMYFDCKDDVKNIIWKNPRPASPRFCRPIFIQFISESEETTKQIVDHIENQIKSLIPTIVIFNNLNVKIIHKVMFTMVDGKICNAVTSTTSPQRCYICGSTSKEFNTILKISNKVNTDTFRFGLSTLHAWIRFFFNVYFIYPTD